MPINNDNDRAFTAPSQRDIEEEPTFAGALSMFRRKYSRDLSNVDLVFWGIPLDVTVSNRPGARFGPQAVRRASAIFCQDPAWPFGFSPFAELATIDYGDCLFDYGRLQEVPDKIVQQASTILQSGAKLISLGGDHFATWPLLQAHHAIHGPLALIQFDAHQDTWPDDEGRMDHGSFVGRAVKKGVIDSEHSIQIGIRTHAPESFGIEICDAAQCMEMNAADIAKQIRTRVGNRKAYLTFDIDCLDPAYAPGTGTPVPGGLSSGKALAVLRELAALNIVGFDVVEVSPAYDHADMTALAAANIAQHFAALAALSNRK